MRRQARQKTQAALDAPPRVALRGEVPLQAPTRGNREAPRGLSTADLAFAVYASFRAHPHINNVLTHISRANWTRLEQSLRSILDLTTPSDGLSPLEQNIVDLMCADRGTTGKILRPYFHGVLRKVLEPDQADRMIRHVDFLFLELQWQALYPPPKPARRQTVDAGVEIRTENKS